MAYNTRAWGKMFYNYIVALVLGSDAENDHKTYTHILHTHTAPTQEWQCWYTKKNK